MAKTIPQRDVQPPPKEDDADKVKTRFKWRDESEETKAKVVKLLFVCMVLAAAFCVVLSINDLSSRQFVADKLPFHAFFACITLWQIPILARILTTFKQTGTVPRRLQVGLRDLLLLTLLASIFFASYTYNRHEKHKRDVVRQRIEQTFMDVIRQGHVHISGRPDRLSVWVNRSSFDDTNLKRLALLNKKEVDERYVQIHRIRFDNCNITDHSAAIIAQWEGLESIFITNTQITDQGLQALAELPKLRSLTCGGDGITPEGLDRLAERFPDLTINRLGQKRRAVPQSPKASQP